MSTEQGTATGGNGEPSIKRSKSGRQLHLAVSGCTHGELDRLYARMAEIESAEGFTFDLLICCGDFQVGFPTVGSEGGYHEKWFAVTEMLPGSYTEPGLVYATYRGKIRLCETTATSSTCIARKNSND